MHVALGVRRRLAARYDNPGGNTKRPPSPCGEGAVSVRAAQAALASERWASASAQPVHQRVGRSLPVASTALA